MGVSGRAICNRTVGMKGVEAVPNTYEAAKMGELICVLTRIAECLERIEKVLPGGNQEALQAEVRKAVISVLASERTHLEYK